ncbi:hypothetical protein EMM73_11340 [Rheinheimera sediminis]|uniref:hypothetical protein n=1 Tax=Rheinheimera sp. YQF-1 TaxID=2499626 RepID=UPI000FDB156E|nr:hypothetical protein [Rheinheimera sp. YQF-1]RVT45804.1 hypothetical protein EMM73_11340 [Rheinheimera sp. YQF-1]
MVHKIKYPAVFLLIYLICALIDLGTTYYRQAKIPATTGSSAELSVAMQQLMQQHRLTGTDLSQAISDLQQQKKRYLE